MPSFLLFLWSLSETHVSITQRPSAQAVGKNHQRSFQKLSMPMFTWCAKSMHWGKGWLLSKCFCRKLGIHMQKNKTRLCLSPCSKIQLRRSNIQSREMLEENRGELLNVVGLCKDLLHTTPNHRKPKQK